MLTTDKHPCPHWDSNPRSQQASGRRPTPYTARLLGPAAHLRTISNFLKFPPRGAEFFHADRRTDMTKLTVSFRNFVNAPQICGYFSTNIRAAGRRLGPTDLFFQLQYLIDQSFVKILRLTAFWTTSSKAHVTVRMRLEMAVQLRSGKRTLGVADYLLTHMVSNV